MSLVQEKVFVANVLFTTATKGSYQPVTFLLKLKAPLTAQLINL